MDFNEVIKQRYSCRSFADRQLSDEDLNAILEAGRIAPTAKNFQEHHIYVVQSPELLAKVDECSRCRFGAPTVLILTYDRNNQYTYPKSTKQSGIEDVSIVATHMMLAATNVGVGSCWINSLLADKLQETFSLPENEDVVMMLILGYPSENAAPLEMHFTRKPIEENVTFLK